MGRGRLSLVPAEQGEPEVDQLKPLEKYAVKQQGAVAPEFKFPK
ncbi:MAG: hypothetical protein JWO19_4345 [Bryobacterales bacterium]|nr:hypothetical protein [Bryobacterales bacterium]